MTPFPRDETGCLRRLALLRGVQTSYFDILRRRVVPPPETLLAVLRCLGEPLETVRDAPGALRRAEESAWDRVCPPVCVAWDGAPASLPLRVPRRLADGRARVRISLDGGETREAAFDLSRFRAVDAGNGGAGECVAKTIVLPWKTPPGYHRLRVELRGIRGEATVVSAPSRAWSSREGERRGFGVFLPLYALHSRRSPNGGDLTDLRALMDWVEELGGDAVATLPLLSACSPEPLEPSPYSPCSRLAWNESCLDPARAPGFGECRAAREILSSAAYREEAERLRRSPFVDHRRGMEMKRRVLEPLARRFFRGGGGAEGDFRRFLSGNRWLEEYAAFRAAWDARGKPWPAWPSPSRDGTLREGDFDGASKRYHLFVQWALHLQLRELSSGPRKLLYLDMPLGASRDGYDVWSRRALFAMEASAGAPPDDFFVKGQDWGFPPLLPERSREEGHLYFRQCLANQLRYAGTLRIDHVMGLHRFFWVPRGAGAAEGAYVRYPAGELYAVVCLESVRHRARIVGEDLGTVPPYVRPAMARHGILRMHVAQFGLSAERCGTPARIPRGSVACMNTHDMPTFASFWEGLDIDDRLSLGLLDRPGAAREKAARKRTVRALSACLGIGGKTRGARGVPGPESALRGCLARLAESPAETVIVNLEDLWLERAPQNTPGTWRERPNWIRKCRYPLEEFRRLPEVVHILGEICRIRRRSGKGRGNARRG
jgi:4-alpha-glucanotransferase